MRKLRKLDRVWPKMSSTERREDSEILETVDVSSDSLEVALPSLDVCVSRVIPMPVCEWSDRMSEILQPGNCTRQKNDVFYEMSGTSDVGANKLKEMSG